MAYRYNHKTGNFDYDDDDAESSYNYDNSYDDSNDYEEPEPYFGDNVYDYSMNKYRYNKWKRGEYDGYDRTVNNNSDDDTVSLGKVLSSIIDKIF
ncbi:MAG: hypothetical protein J6Y24_16230 [Bacteroidales bacterium]|nr:hypothetical protein [Bacteroidales bacterium]